MPRDSLPWMETPIASVDDPDSSARFLAARKAVGRKFTAGQRRSVLRMLDVHPEQVGTVAEYATWIGLLSALPADLRRELIESV